MESYLGSVATFDKLAKQYQDKYMDFDFYLDTYDRFCQLLTQHDARVLEIGCGPGNVSRYLLKQQPALQLLGIDLAPNMIELAQQNNPQALYSVQNCLQIDDLGTFDAVFSGFCTPYLSTSEVAQLIQQVAQVLTRGGLLYLSTMEDTPERSGIQTSSAGDQVFIYYHQYPVLEKLLIDSGFDIIEIERKAFAANTAQATTDLFIYARLR